MQIGFIGAGKAGVSLGKYFKEKGRKIGGYYSLSPKSAKWAAAFTETTHYENLQEIISSCDMIFFTVPDDAIRDVWQEAKPFVSGKIVAHCSGLHSSKIFSDIDSTGSSAYSIHPLCAISSRENSWKLLYNTLFTIEGDKKNISIIQDLFNQTGNRTKIILAENKTKYHAAASLASNHMTAVFFMAKKLLQDCGFEEKEAEAELYCLAKGNLCNILEQGCTASLTGPVERNDKSTVEAHIRALNGATRMAYCVNAEQLVELAEKKHPLECYDEMKQILNSGVRVFGTEQGEI